MMPLRCLIRMPYPMTMRGLGVPISFLDKYCPEQFEIVAFRKGNDGKDLVYSTRNSGHSIIEGEETIAKQPYFRILIHHCYTGNDKK